MREQARLAGVSVVLPVHGNARVLPELCRRIRDAVGRRELEIIMVDDASPDDSLAVMRELHVVVVALAPRRGQNAALLAGLRRARQPLACVMDADLQDPPEAIPLLLEPLERTGVRVVFSSREAAPRASSRLFRAVIRLLYPSLPRTPCLCFALDTGTRAALLELATDRDYLVAAIGALGVPTASVPVPRSSRPHGRSATEPGGGYATRSARSLPRRACACARPRSVSARTPPESADESAAARPHRQPGHAATARSGGEIARISGSFWCGYKGPGRDITFHLGHWLSHDAPRSYG